jgi:hypothetical protein
VERNPKTTDHTCFPTNPVQYLVPYLANQKKIRNENENERIIVPTISLIKNIILYSLVGLSAVEMFLANRHLPLDTTHRGNIHVTHFSESHYYFLLQNCFDLSGFKSFKKKKSQEFLASIECFSWFLYYGVHFPGAIAIGRS